MAKCLPVRFLETPTCHSIFWDTMPCITLKIELKWRYFPPKRRLVFIVPHGVISQKINLNYFRLDSKRMAQNATYYYPEAEEMFRRGKTLHRSLIMLSSCINSGPFGTCNSRAYTGHWVESWLVHANWMTLINHYNNYGCKQRFRTSEGCSAQRTEG
jgi:hypothetical protein